ncbi:hypothetical protein CHI02_20435 [Niallia circulans]|nr:hypothetical protein CHI02_20435 [Niallia circulans]
MLSGIKPLEPFEREEEKLVEDPIELPENLEKMMGEMQSNKPLNECEWWMLTLKIEMSEVVINLDF